MTLALATLDMVIQSYMDVIYLLKDLNSSVSHMYVKGEQRAKLMQVYFIDLSILP